MNINPLGNSAGNQVLGVMVDGKDLRIAHLGSENGQIIIHSLESYVLPTRLGKIRKSEVTFPAAIEDERGDVLGFDESDQESEGFDDIIEDLDEEGEDVSSSIIHIFDKYPLKQARIAANIPEGQATYYSFDSDFGLNGKKLKSRLQEEIAPLAGGSLETAIVDHFKTDSDNLMVVVSEGNIPIMEEILDVKNFLSSGNPYFCQVNANEISLVNLVRLSIDPADDIITAVIYIGADFSRVILMKGKDPISFIQAIHEGYHSPQVCQTLFSKILLEQEEAGIPEIDKIVLAGEIGMTRAHDFFTKQFPNIDVQPITSGPLDTGMLKNEEIAIFPNFAIPVAMAWEALDRKNPDFIRADLLPPSIVENQRSFKIAWHGLLLLGVIFVCMLFLSYFGITRFKEIQALKSSISTKQSSIESLQQDLLYISQLQSQINQNNSNLSFLDSLVVDANKWSRLFAKLSTDFKNINRIWIERIQSTPEGFTMQGKSLSRDKIPVLAAGFSGVNLRRVSRIISEAGQVEYQFELDANIPIPPEKEIATVSDVSSDRNQDIAGSIKDGLQPSDKTISREKSEKTASVTRSNVNSGKKGEFTPLYKGTTVSSSKSKVADKPKTKLAQRKTTSTAITQLYANGMNLIKNRDIENAAVEFKKLVLKYPTSDEAPSAYYWIGECAFSQKHYEEAIEAFTTSLRYNDNPKRQAGMVMLGMSYLKLGNEEKAQKQFESLLDAFPEGEFTETAQRKLKELTG
ncbi:hypothetical protein CEE37_10685 [candidate division LCP-89 bacterium B3_LCP]|uniref:Outer membrane lipoprotein BamD-like domain-containing protein n=1 Tax=candidate division LCP-89 bacterium B3_LCP TaxID=2012998 RepID=A0A532UXS1_UNCL8|nr:MAG: hypothetical protein CEE37_10685 [candidate division LCP-89 bacterium B3_LCP]